MELIGLGVLATELRQLPSAILNERADHMWAVLGILEERSKNRPESP